MTVTVDRSRMIERHLPLVRGIARRFAGRGEPLDDLVQVGNVALIAAVDRCDPERRERFTSYAALCVEGEIRRHLRDRCVPLRIPRSVQTDAALVARLRAASDVDAEAETLVAPQSFDELGLTRALIASAARHLDRRERRIVALRYFLDLSQSEIGDEIGISQVQVSRVLDRALRKMRDELADSAPVASETELSRLG